MEILNLAELPGEKIPNAIKSYVEYLMTKPDLPVFNYDIKRMRIKLKDFLCLCIAKTWIFRVSYFFRLFYLSNFLLGLL